METFLDVLFEQFDLPFNLLLHQFKNIKLKQEQENNLNRRGIDFQEKT